MKRRSVILLLTASLALSAALSGCSGDDGKEASKSEQTSSSNADTKESDTEDSQTGDEAEEEADADAAGTGTADTDAAQNPDSGTAEAAQDTGKDETAPAEEKEKKKVVMYTTVNLILRKKGNMDAEKIEILPVNTKVTVLKKGKEWYKVKANGKKGFVFAEYLTKSKKEAKEAEAQAAAAEAQAAAEAAAQAAADAAAQNSYTAGQNNTAPSGGGRTEVSREDYPDCDGSGHGYSEIHYSDGTTEIVEY